MSNPHTPKDMTDSHREYADFLRAQFGILMDSTITVQQNGIKYHDAHCEHPFPDCEAEFMLLYLMHFGQLLQGAIAGESEPKGSVFVVVEPPNPN